MLLASKHSAEPDHKYILESTAGIAFMGTPHCGSRVAEWRLVCAKIAALVRSTNKAVNILEPDSEVLARVQGEFHTMLRARTGAGKEDIRIMCFFEDHVTPVIGYVSY